MIGIVDVCSWLFSPVPPALGAVLLPLDIAAQSIQSDVSFPFFTPNICATIEQFRTRSKQMEARNAATVTRGIAHGSTEEVGRTEAK